MQCQTIDETVTQPAPPRDRVCVAEISSWRLLSSALGLGGNQDAGHDTGVRLWDTGHPGVDMSSRPLSADSATSIEASKVADPIEAAGDTTLSDALRAGDGHAVARLFDLYGEHVERVLIRTIGRDTEMDDMVQDVFLGAYRSGPNYQGNDEQLKAWISRIAVFTARGYLRKRKRRWWLRSSDPGEMPEQTSNEPSPHTSEVLRRTYAALDTMDPDLRIPFSLRELESMELAEIAKACDCSVSTVKRRLARARKAFDRLAKKDPILREWLGDEN